MPVTHAADPAPVPVPSAAPGLTPPPLAAPRLSDRVLALADRHRRWVSVGVLALYLAGFNAQWRLEADSALYLSIGRNFADGHGYTYHGKFHRLAYPGVPLMFAGLFKAFGTNTVLPHLTLMWLMGLAALGLVYRLFLLHAGRPTAVLITFGVAISRVFYRYTFELLSDLPFLLGVLAFFVGYEALFYRQTTDADRDDRAGDGVAAPQAARPAVWFDGVLLVAGLALAVSTRPAMWALVPAAGLAALWSVARGRARWGHVAVAGLVVLAVAVFYLKDPRHQPTGPAGLASTSYVEEDQLFHLHAGKIATMARTAARNLPGVLEGPLERATFGTPLAPGLNAALAAVIAAAGVLLARRRPLWGTWVLATLAMVALVPKAVDRYFLPIVPVLVFAWWTCTRWAERQFTGRAAAGVFLLLFGLGGVTNTAATLGFVLEQRRMPFLAHYKEGRYASAYDAARMLERHTPPSGATLDPRTTWVAVPEKFARVLTFLSRRYCTEPDAGTQIDPRRQTVYVLNPTEPVVPDPDSRRPPTPEWLKERGTEVVPVPVASTPNKNPSDPRPWTLHRTAPLEVPGTRPATTWGSTRERISDPARAPTVRGTHGGTVGVRARDEGATGAVARTVFPDEDSGTPPTPTALPWVPRAVTGTSVLAHALRRARAMKISIVTPTLNRRAYLASTGESILSQAGDFDLDWIVVDGGSTDGSVGWLADRAARDPRVRYTSGRDRGQSDAINKGLTAATGDVVAWLNADDLYPPGALAAVAAAFAARPAAQWLVGRYEVVDAACRPIRQSIVRYKRRRLDRYTYRGLLRENVVPQPAVFWRRAFGERVGPLDESLHWTMDYDLWLRMGKLSPPLVVDALLARFRHHGASKSGDFNRRQFDEGYEVARRHAAGDRASLLAHRLNVEKIVWAYRALRLIGR